VIFGCFLLCPFPTDFFGKERCEGGGKWYMQKKDNGNLPSFRKDQWEGVQYAILLVLT